MYQKILTTASNEVQFSAQSRKEFESPWLIQSSQSRNFKRLKEYCTSTAFPLS